MTALDDALTDAFAIGTALGYRADAQAAAYVGQLLAEKSRHEIVTLVSAQHRIIWNLIVATAEEFGKEPVQLWRDMAADFQQQLADRQVG